MHPTVYLFLPFLLQMFVKELEHVLGTLKKKLV